MKDEEIIARINELETIFADVPCDALMRFVNRQKMICLVCEKKPILRAMIVSKCDSREELKSFLANSVPERFLSNELSSSEDEEAIAKISCYGRCQFNPPIPRGKWGDDWESFRDEILKRDNALLQLLQKKDDEHAEKKQAESEGFTTAAGTSKTAKAEAAFRDGIVKQKMSELEQYVKQQMKELKETTLTNLELFLEKRHSDKQV